MEALEEQGKELLCVELSTLSLAVQHGLFVLGQLGV